MDSTSSVFFQKQLDFTNQHHHFHDCPYYPCHKLPLKSGQSELNCFFCFCPFYPCENTVGTGTWIKIEDGSKVWDCSQCGVVHEDSFVKDSIQAFYAGQSTKDICEALKHKDRKAL